MKRRDFLKRIIKAFFLILSFSILPVLTYIYPSKTRNRILNYMYLMDEDDLPKRGVRKVDFQYAMGEKIVSSRIFIAATSYGLVVFSSVCTHLGCMVNWDNNKKEFLCPCHGGKYDINGEVISGPPPGPLMKLPLEIRDGKVYVGIKI